MSQRRVYRDGRPVWEPEGAGNGIPHDGMSAVRAGGLAYLEGEAEGSGAVTSEYIDVAAAIREEARAARAAGPGISHDDFMRSAMRGARASVASRKARRQPERHPWRAQPGMFESSPEAYADASASLREALR